MLRFIRLCSLSTVLLLPNTNDVAEAQNTTTNSTAKQCPYNWCVYKRRYSYYSRRSYSTTKTCRLIMQTCPADLQDCCSKGTGCCSLEKLAPYLITIAAIAGIGLLCCLLGCGAYAWHKRKQKTRSDGATQGAVSYPRQQTPVPSYPVASPGYAAPAPGYPPSPGYAAAAPGYPAPSPGYPAPPQGYPAPYPGYSGYSAPYPGYPASNSGYPAPGTSYPQQPANNDQPPSYGSGVPDASPTDHGHSANIPLVAYNAQQRTNDSASPSKSP